MCDARPSLKTRFALRRSRLCALAAALLGFCVCRPASADGRDFHEQVPVPSVPPWLTVPFEYGHGAAWTETGSSPAYRLTAGVLPGVNIGRFTVQAAFQVLYRNPDWDLGLGGRTSVHLGSLSGGFLPVRVLAEASYLPIHGGGYVAGGLSLGIGRLLYVAALYGKDTDRSTNFFGVRLGVDLPSLWDPIGAVTRDVPQQDFGARVPCGS